MTTSQILYQVLKNESLIWNKEQDILASDKWIKMSDFEKDTKRFFDNDKWLLWAMKTSGKRHSNKEWFVECFGVKK